MEASKVKAAIVYDFDGTLAEGDCAQHGLMPAIGIEDVGAFWRRVKEETKTRDGDEILTYLGLLALQARVVRKREVLRPERLRDFGSEIPLFPGVEIWFEHINGFANEHNIQLDHYIVSSGIEQMILGTPIAHHFKKIFGCKYHYDDKHKYAKWPAVAINYTTKTQFIFRINKGALNCYDNVSVNEYVEPRLRPVPFEHMIYLGDGDTDIPCMRLVKDMGGCSIAVFDPKKWEEPRSQEKIEKLISEDRVNYVVPGDYSKETQLDVTVRGILRKIGRKIKA